MNFEAENPALSDVYRSNYSLLDEMRGWILEQIPLFKCFLVALSLHVTFLPLIWMMGWALPWPRPQAVTIVVEYDLSNWPREAKPKKILEFVDPEPKR